jgi:hypothetical protein
MSKRKLYALLPPGFPFAGIDRNCTGGNVSKHFGGIQAVSGANLSVQSEKFTFDWAERRRKTTLFNLISSLYRPDSGTIRLSGRDIHGLLFRHLPRGQRAVPNHEPIQCLVDLREYPSTAQARHPVGLTSGATLIVIRRERGKRLS